MTKQYVVYVPVPEKKLDDCVDEIIGLLETRFHIDRPHDDGDSVYGERFFEKLALEHLLQDAMREANAVGGLGYAWLVPNAGEPAYLVFDVETESDAEKLVGLFPDANS